MVSGNTRRNKALVWLRRPLIGVPLAGAAVAFLALNWADSWPAIKVLMTDFPILVLAAATVTYSLGLLALAAGVAVLLERNRSVFWGALAGQILKYLPGAVWQGMPAAAERSVGGFVTYGLATIGAAAAGLLLARQAPLVLLGGTGFAVLAAVACRRVGLRTTVSATFWLCSSAVLIGGSGALVACAFDLNPYLWGRHIAASWSLGVLSIPVPAGLGIRELALTALADANTAHVAAMATTHRAVSLVGDLVVGLVGMATYSMSRGR